MNANQNSGILSIEDLNRYVEKGNEAIEGGNVDECIKWYTLGLSKARALKNSVKAREFSHLLITLL
jgi:hypothetical protein